MTTTTTTITDLIQIKDQGEQKKMAYVFGEDITENLKSLSFEAGVSEDERDILYVRKRSHAVRTCIIGQVCYLVAIVNEGKKLIYEKEHSKVKKTTLIKGWKEAPQRRPLKIGLIGCGAMGKQLVLSLQQYSDIRPEEILISTRRPDTLTEFKEMGINCFFDNKKNKIDLSTTEAEELGLSLSHVRFQLVKSTDIAFICCLPSQFESVVEDIAGKVRCLLYSFMAAIPRSRLCEMLRYDDVIKPEFIFANKQQTSNSDWNYKQKISQALEDASYCQIACPGNCNDGAIVKTSSKLAELMVLVFVNMCIVQGLSRDDIVKFTNDVIFGPPTEENAAVLREDDVWNQESEKLLSQITVDESNYQIFSLEKLHHQTSSLGKILEDEMSDLSLRFQKRFISLFDRFTSWKTHCRLSQN